MARKREGVVDPRRELVRLLKELSYHRHIRDVFRDFVEMSACAISNAVDYRPYRKEREETYMRAVGRYDREKVPLFKEAFHTLVDALDRVPFEDVLGKVATELEVFRHGGTNQILTPMSLALLMAKVTLGDRNSLEAQIAEEGYIEISEPTCGTGVMVIAAAQAILDEWLNYQKVMHATCCDVDVTMVHASYVQLSLLGIPAVVVHGDTLCLEEWSHWYTPLHVIGGWDRRLRAKPRQERKPVGGPRIPTLAEVVVPEGAPSLAAIVGEASRLLEDGAAQAARAVLEVGSRPALDDRSAAGAASRSRHDS